jgi:hypothetical protein
LCCQGAFATESIRPPVIWERASTSEPMAFYVDWARLFERCSGEATPKTIREDS